MGTGRQHDATGRARGADGSIAARWLSGAPLPERAHLLLGLLAPLAVFAGCALRVRSFTIDAAYIGFRYAENLAGGAGLVYNPGERVEGYTSLLWTLLLAAANRLGLPTEPTAKLLGGVAGGVAIALVYFVARRIRPLGGAPCVATWLCASSFPFTGYSVFGLEGSLVAALELGGVLLLWRELDEEDAASEATRLPWSGLVLAAAALAGTEALLLVGLLALAWGGRPLGRRAVVRVALVAIPVAAQLVFRRATTGSFVPNGFVAHTGGLAEQLRGGREYLANYLAHEGAFVWLAVGGLAIAIVRYADRSAGARPDARALVGLAIAFQVVSYGTYLVLLGGEWLPYFRLMAPIEPFVFLLVDDAVRGLLEVRRRDLGLALAVLGAWTAYARITTLREAQRNILTIDKAFWDDAAGRTARWLVEEGRPGAVATGDVGLVGYRTKRPIVDLLGALTPEIARVPGPYGRKVGRGFADAVFDRSPRYVVVVSGNRDCKSPSVPTSRALFDDRRFAAYALEQAVHLRSGGAWCIYGRPD